MRIVFITLLWGCSGDKESSEASSSEDSVASLDPSADEDGDGINNGDEEQAGSDPFDAADVPYLGGWGKDAECRYDITPTGNEVGQVAENFGLIDQYGDTVYLHDFCGRPLLIEFAGFT